MPQTQVRQIQVIASTSGNADLKAIANSLGQINQNATTLLGGLRGLQGAFASYYAVLKVGQLTAIADEITNLQSRLKILSGSTEEGARAFQAIQQIAGDTRSSITEAGSSYSRLAGVLHEAGASTQVLTTLTTALINTFRLSGESSEAAKNATIQFAQGLAIGKLRGQDLRSVLSQNAVYGELLAKSLHKSRGELLEFAAEGKITAEQALRPLFNNAADVNAKVGEMTHTFGDSFTLALNKFQVAIGAVNSKFGVSSTFYNAVEYVIEKLPLIAVAMGVLSTVAIPALIVGFINLTTASLAFAASNPILLFLSAFSVAIVVGTKDLNTFTNGLLDFASNFLRVRQAAIGALDPVAKFIDKITFSQGASKALKFDADDTAASIAKLQSLKVPTLVPEPEKIGATSDELEKFLAKLPKIPPEVAKLKDILGELNTKYLQGKITFTQYNDALNDFDLMKLNREFSEGKTELEKYRINAIAVFAVLNQRAFNLGRIDLQEYNAEVKNLKIDELRVKFEAGKITLAEYNVELLKTRENFRGAYEDTKPLQVGIQNYLSSVGTFATGIASVVQGAFGHLEDALVDFVKKGKLNFADLTNAILDDLLKIIIRASIVSPLANGLLTGLQGAGTSFAGRGTTYTGGDSVGGGFSSVSALGNVFDSGLKKFANGGIVSSPTMFKYGAGSSGLMGEAGPEAIVPLSRGSGGKLGVNASLSPVTINVVNQSSAEVTTQETTDSSGVRIVEMLIKNKVSETISNGGFDKALKNSFGLQRKGN